MIKNCDNLSVGVIIEDSDRIALLKRANFPIAIAPPAGHIDAHGSPEQAATDEIFEELGLTVAKNALLQTSIRNRRVENQCGRIGGNHHYWWVYRTLEFGGELTPCPDETQGAAWYHRNDLQTLADRTRALLAKSASQLEWQQNPGLEPTWVSFFVELGYVE